MALYKLQMLCACATLSRCLDCGNHHLNQQLADWVPVLRLYCLLQYVVVSI
jgi:hypothetical protein